MKKGLLLTIALATSSLFASAQLIPDGGFDNWSSNSEIGTWEFVSGARGRLSTSGLVDGNGNAIPVHNGSDALVLQNTANISVARNTFPISSRPSTLQGAFGYYNSEEGERFAIVITMTKWDAVGNKRDTIMDNAIATGPAQGYAAWNLIQFNLTSAYATAETPDTCSITIFASALTNPNTATANTVLLVDALDLNDWTVSAPMVVTPILDVESYPNPATTSMKISYNVGIESDVNVTITDMTGKTVATVFEGTQSQGRQEVEVDVTALKPGVYFYTVKAGNAVETKKFIVTK